MFYILLTILGFHLFIALAAMARYTLSLDLSLSFIMSGLLTVLAVAATVWKQRYFIDKTPSGKGIRFGFSCSLLLGFWVCVFATYLWPLAENGLFAIGSVDAASHLSLILEYLADKPQTYFGFLELYTFTGLLHKFFGFPLIVALSTAIYCLLSVGFLSWALAASDIIDRQTHHKVGLIAGSFLLTVVVALKIVYPLIYYNLGEGFWPHLTSIALPLTLLLIAATVDRPLGRLGLYLVSVMIYRYAYGLNIGDALAAMAFVSALTAKREAHRTRWMLLALSVGLAMASTLAYYKLLPVMTTDGGITHHDLLRSLQGAAVLLGAFIAYAYFLLEDDIGSPLHRVLEVALPFCFFGLLFQTAYYFSHPIQYYILKYGLHLLIVLALLIPIVLPLLTARMARFFRRRDFKNTLLSALILAAIIHGVDQVSVSYHSYRMDMDRWVRNTVPASPMFSQTVVDEIEAVLKEAELPYVLTLAPQWPSINFLNVYMTRSTDPRATIFRSMSALQSGRVNFERGCVFWFKKSPFINGWTLPKLQKTIQRFAASEDSHCREPSSSSEAQVHVCYLCRS